MCKRFRVILNILIVLRIRIISADSPFDVLRTPRSFEKQSSRGIMSPKMDYDEWTPLGRGDPLKNDPTFDYSPPMVSKVKYWISESQRTPDPPIVPIKELTTETSQITAAITSSSSSSSSSSSTATRKSSQQSSKQPTAESIKRFYIDFKDPSDTSYVHLMNTKFNNKFVRPQNVQYQNHFYTPAPRQPPPPPLPMLVPPPPIEPNSYSTKPDNISTSSLTHSWDINKTPQPTTLPAALAPVVPAAAVTSSVSKPFTTARPEPSPMMKTEPPILKLLLDKETSDSYHTVTIPTTVKPLTPNPITSFTSSKQYSHHPARSPTYLIIQGHSKVKKYGAGKIERSDDVLTQDTNDIVNEPTKYELPKEIRGGRQIGVEDFLPFDGILGESFKDFVSSQAEGSGFGAELTRVMFPAYVRSTPAAQYESPRSQEEENEEIQEVDES